MIKTVCIAAMAASAAAFAPSTGVRWIRFRSLGSESDSRGGEARPGSIFLLGRRSGLCALPVLAVRVGCVDAALLGHRPV